MTIDYESIDHPHGTAAKRNWQQALIRGLRGKCPNCGKGKLFRKYLKIAATCNACSEELHHHRADDAPPYFTIFATGHIIIPLTFFVDYTWRPTIWIHMAIWLPLALILTLMLLPIVKGAVVGLQWALRMHGFEYSALCSPKSPDQAG